MTWRLVDTDLCSPAYSAAADEAMALARSRGEVPNTLHFYRRDRPTVSLGYFQKAGEAVDLEFCRSRGIQLVRRVTGGSAIYTDKGHLIYGLALDADALPARREEAFATVCGAIVSALAAFGLEAEHRHPNDVLIAGRKVSGSAQLRRRGIILVHGTVVVRHDPAMMAGALRMDRAKVRARGLEPETYVTSLEEALGSMPDLSAVKTALARAFGRAFGTEFDRSGFTESEEDSIHGLMETKYGQDSWNLRY